MEKAQSRHAGRQGGEKEGGEYKEEDAEAAAPRERHHAETQEAKKGRKRARSRGGIPPKREEL